MSNVVQHQTAIWKELKDWCDREQSHSAQARACWPEIASRMARLRRDYPSNIEFGAALVLHGIEYNSNDRAAFIWMGRLSKQALEDAMARCDRANAETFRREVESWRDPYFSPSSEASENPEPAPTSEPEAPPVEPKTQESTPDPIPESGKADHADLPEKLDVRMLLVKKLKEADSRMLLKHYPNQQTRRMLGRMGKNQLLALVEKIRSGKFGVVNKGLFEKKFSARMLVPELPKEWTRNRSFEPTDNKNINILLGDSDHFLAMRDAGCRTMEECNHWWMDNVLHRKAVDVTINPPRASTQASESADAILVHGKVIWPPASFISHPEDYPRDLAVDCFHLWQNLDRQFKVKEPSPLGRGRLMAQVAMDLSKINKAAGDLVRQMAFAQQKDISGNLETSRLTRLIGDYDGF